jgi:hypothetical protein
MSLDVQPAEGQTPTQGAIVSMLRLSMHCHGGVGSDNIMSRCVHLFTPAPVGMIYIGWQAVYIKRFTFEPPREPLKTSCDLNAATGVTAITVTVMSSIIINDRSNIRAA